MPPSKRQIEEREVRKQRILKGALEVFKLQGLEGATMDQIAQQSGCASHETSQRQSAFYHLNPAHQS